MPAICRESALESQPNKSTQFQHGRRLRRVIRWVLSFHGSPRQVARGMAIGVLVAFTPPVGLQMILAAILATLSKSNRPAAIAAVWITNPLTALPIYLLTYRVGLAFLPHIHAIELRKRLVAVVVDEHGEWLNLAHQFRELIALGAEVLVPMTVGGLVVGLAAACAAYFVTLAICQLAPTRLRLRR